MTKTKFRLGNGPWRATFDWGRLGMVAMAAGALWLWYSSSEKTPLADVPIQVPRGYDEIGRQEDGALRVGCVGPRTTQVLCFHGPRMVSIRCDSGLVAAPKAVTTKCPTL